MDFPPKISVFLIMTKPNRPQKDEEKVSHVKEMTELEITSSGSLNQDLPGVLAYMNRIKWGDLKKKGGFQIKFCFFAYYVVAVFFLGVLHHHPNLEPLPLFMYAGWDT